MYRRSETEREKGKDGEEMWRYQFGLHKVPRSRGKCQVLSWPPRGFCIIRPGPRYYSLLTPTNCTRTPQTRLLDPTERREEEARDQRRSYYIAYTL